MRVNKKIIASVVVLCNCVFAGTPVTATTVDSLNPTINAEDSLHLDVATEVDLSTEIDFSGENKEITSLESNEDILTEEYNGENEQDSDHNINPPAKIPSLYRISGATRYETAKAISEYYNNGTVNSVILTIGNQFADALSASVLAHAKEAPILLVDSALDKSLEAFSYINQHLDSSGTIYIIGGTGIIGPEFETRLNALGFSNIVRIAGANRYDTSLKIAEYIEDHSTIVLSSGEQYPDALSISSFAAKNGWPILLTQKDTINNEIIEFLKEKNPAKIYITGGEGAISNNVINKLHKELPVTTFQRLSGASRFDTNLEITETFAPNPSILYIATGYGFADALAGSILAAKTGDPIIFVNPSQKLLPRPVVEYFETLHSRGQYPNIVAFGGKGIISDDLLKSSQDLISGKMTSGSIHSIDDLEATVYQHEAFELPKTVIARLYNNDAKKVTITWNALADTATSGKKVYEGFVDGYNRAIKFTLNVNKPLGQYTTYFNPGEIDRTTNLRLSAEAINNVKLLPGEIFSFNKTVGRRTPQAGYKEAYVIIGDEYVLGVGGGICQVSSTLYNSVLDANLVIVERHSHSIPVDYVPVGKDATVAYPYLDFKFRNNSQKTVMIRSILKNNSLTIQLHQH